MTAQATTTSATDAQEEYHDKPVPLQGRLGFKEPALVWSGFGIAYICAVIAFFLSSRSKRMRATRSLVSLLIKTVILE